MKGVNQRSCIIPTAQDLFITWKASALHQWDFEMSFASINYARPLVALRQCCVTFVDYYLYFKILCRLKAVLSYICWSFFYFKKNIEIRVFILPHCDFKCADNVNLTLYFLPTQPSTQIVIFSLYDKISSFRKICCHHWDWNFHLNVTCKNDP